MYYQKKLIAMLGYLELNRLKRQADSGKNNTATFGYLDQ